MSTPRNRREFLSSVGQGMLVASLGSAVAVDLGLAVARADDGSDALTFGPHEPLVALLQETPSDRLLPLLVERLRNGTDLRSLVAAAALANARTFGGEDYIGFHTMMAIAPAYHMAAALPTERQALPVLKVLYRNTQRIGEHGGRSSEVLHTVSADAADKNSLADDALRNAVHAQDVVRAERTLAALANRSPEDAFNHTLYVVQESPEVHRVVMPYRAWELIGLIGNEHALTLLRQSVRYCVMNETSAASGVNVLPRTLLPKLMDQFHLADRAPGDRAADDAWVEEMSHTFFQSTPEQAAETAAAALADGFSPDVLSEAIALAANQLVLRDPGRTALHESPGKPIGSVHGDSIGVHACDTANAWRNMARVGNVRNQFASVILGAYQVARDRSARSVDFQNSTNPLPFASQLDRLKTTEPAALLAELDEAIRGNLQARACALVQRYGAGGHPPRDVFDVLLRYAISEDGALHAEKYYRTASEEFARTRPAFRWRQLTALARVTASEYGRRAAGYNQACELLNVTA